MNNEDDNYLIELKNSHLGLIPFRIDNGLWGLMNYTGAIILKPRFNRIQTFKDNFVGYDSTGAYILSKDAVILNKNPYSYVSSYDEKSGVFKVDYHKKSIFNKDTFQILSGYVNKDGKELLKCGLYSLSDFNGYGIIKSRYNLVSNTKLKKNQIIYYIIDKNGNIIMEFKNEIPQEVIGDIIVTNKGYYNIQTKDKIFEEYYIKEEFSKGKNCLFKTAIGINKSKNSREEVLLPSGETIFCDSLDEYYLFKNEYDTFYIKSEVNTDLLGLMDINGKILVECNYKTIKVFKNNYIIAYGKNGNINLYHRSGRISIDKKYKDILVDEENNLIFGINDNDEKVLLSINLQNHTSYELYNGYSFNKYTTCYGYYIDLVKEEICYDANSPFKYKSHTVIGLNNEVVFSCPSETHPYMVDSVLDYHDNGIFLVKIKDKDIWIILDQNGNEINRFNAIVAYVENNYIKVIENGIYFGLRNINGDIVLSSKYKKIDFIDDETLSIKCFADECDIFFSLKYSKYDCELCYGSSYREILNDYNYHYKLYHDDKNSILKRRK